MKRWKWPSVPPLAPVVVLMLLVPPVVDKQRTSLVDTPSPPWSFRRFQPARMVQQRPIVKWILPPPTSVQLSMFRSAVVAAFVRPSLAGASDAVDAETVVASGTDGDAVVVAAAHVEIRRPHCSHLHSPRLRGQAEVVYARPTVVLVVVVALVLLASDPGRQSVAV